MQVPTVTDTFFNVSSKNVATPTEGEKATQNTIYSFLPVGVSSMILIPHDSKDVVAEYYISVRMNCFMPSSYNTTVYRGADDLSPPVGAFEMGMVAAPSSVRMGRTVNNAATALTQSGAWGSWYWHPANINERYHLRWEFGKRPAICRSANGGRAILAKFTPPTVHLGDQLPELEIFSEGREYMDHILISLLIIERRRLTPGRPDTTKELFN
ncbi:hypothetical protein M413DRAFT_442772 [Hebeloma cylindrosporum]|uniref:DUF6593 domain-containing protein n=1 Tax=Hebeloma cylindrosporum TaxID=76867 RepID=A0A0C2YUW8_HEBCY|nr:hypothetical protein M413DRAFT_442772 [Hebeloma cylindrosporum h7]